MILEQTSDVIGTDMIVKHRLGYILIGYGDRGIDVMTMEPIEWFVVESM